MQDSDVPAAWPPGIPISDEPVRRVHTRGRRRNTSLVYSTHPLGMRVSESSLETFFLQVAQLDPTVRCVRAQPCWLRVVEDGRLRRRAPDFAVLFDSHAELHEVKNDQECWLPEVRSELLSICHEVERHPTWRYSVTLASELKSEPLMSNTALLWRYLRPIDELQSEARLKVAELIGGGPAPGRELAEHLHRAAICSSASDGWFILLSLIAAGIVDFDVRQQLTSETLLWNKYSGPPRERTLPFAHARNAVRPPRDNNELQPFSALRLRRAAG